MGEDLLRSLNDLANPLGFTVVFDDPMWKADVTGGETYSYVFYQSPSPDEVRRYLEERAKNKWWWWLDMRDPTIHVAPAKPGITTEVIISEVSNPDVAIPASGGVCGDLQKGEISSFYCRDADRPSIGRWYR